MSKRDSYKIRLATRSDLDSLYQLEMAAFEKDRFAREQIDYLLTQSRATIFVLKHDSAIAGAAYLLWRRMQHGVRLYNIAINPAYQGRGFGLALLKECELEAARRECEKMSLEVRLDNENAIKFYERQGFKIRYTMHDYYPDGTTGLKMLKVIDLAVPQKIQLNVPYFAQTLNFTCGPACLMMALKYFRPDVELTRATELAIWKEATMIFMASGYAGTDGYGLALSALTKGLSCRLIASKDKVPMLRSVRNQEKREVMKIVHNDMKRKARKAGLGYSVHQYGVDEIISALHRGMLPIVLISTYRLTGDRVPHWVIVTGFDENNVYIHDPDVASYGNKRSKAKNLRVEKVEFLRMSRYGKEVYRCLLLIGNGN